VGDLEGVAGPDSRNRWQATVTITVHDQNETPLSNAQVSGLWNAGADGGDSCVTDSLGQCSLTLNRIKSNESSVSFAVSGVTYGASIYEPGDNHDADGSSDGTTITIAAP
jgi:hypothetical protein